MVYSCDDDVFSLSRFKHLYRAARYNAEHRGIEFLLSFEEWKKIWLDSGHWTMRGKGKGQYCMARFGDDGPYVVGNVRIVTGKENNAEWRANPTINDPFVVAMSQASKERSKNPEFYKGMVVAGRSEDGRLRRRLWKLGRKDSSITRERKAQSAAAAHARRRELHPPIQKICLVCGDIFRPKSKTQCFCSKSCAAVITNKNRQASLRAPKQARAN